MRTQFLIYILAAFAVTFLLGFVVSPHFFWLLVLIVPLAVIGFRDMFQPSHAILRNFPLIGHGRYMADWMRPKIYQYFIESDTDGTPINRDKRSLVYQRAKKEIDTAPFGTQLDVYAEGYEWMAHSIRPKDSHVLNHDPRVRIGGPQCSQPYDLSIFNISAMSYGSLSKVAVLALNYGAQMGGFAHNTGEGGISPYHLEGGGDLIYQVGTGYFGCRSDDGGFSPELFQQTVAHPQIKMIELKLSQGAKPGHGGILPAEKNTPEIAAIRKVTPYTQVDSPPYHRAFDTYEGMLKLLQQMRELADGRPVGFKLCVGHLEEFKDICRTIRQVGIYPDFITVDGGEGGTGAAPLEFTDHVGMPFRDALAGVDNILRGFDLRKDIRIIGSSKILSGFSIFRALSLGADACYSARGMMLALGCIQALECNKNTCPTGVATQDPQLMKGLVVDSKKFRVANYHRKTVEAFVELLGAAGLEHPSQLHRGLVYRRVLMHEVKRYDEIYPYVETGSLI